MVERQLLLYIIFMIWKLTQEHYVPPPNHCIMAMTCNHSGIPLCGFDKNKNCNRMFLDECDLYEYNCDSKAEFYTSEINHCNQNMSDGNYDLCDSKQYNMNGTILTTTTTTSINTTTIKMTTFAEAITTKNTTEEAFSLLTVSNITTCTKENNLTLETVTEKNNTQTLDVTTVYPNVANEEKSNVDKNVTVASNTTKKNNSQFQNTTMIPNNVTKNENSNVDKNVTVASNTTLVTSTSVPISTKKNVSNTATTGNVTDKTFNENNTTIKDKNMTAMASTTTEKQNTSSIAKDVATTTTESMTEQITDKVDVKPEDCDFPSYCDRPKTWLTTSKGETRDFYRIIKDNEGK